MVGGLVLAVALGLVLGGGCVATGRSLVRGALPGADRGGTPTAYGVVPDGDVVPDGHVLARAERAVQLALPVDLGVHAGSFPRVQCGTGGHGATRHSVVTC